MLRHVILWKLKRELPPELISERVAFCRDAFAALPAEIDGLISMRLITEPLPSSSCDLMLDSCFEDEAALAAYRDDPRHLRVATVIRQLISERVCMDFIEE